MSSSILTARDFCGLEQSVTLRLRRTSSRATARLSSPKSSLYQPASPSAALSAPLLPKLRFWFFRLKLRIANLPEHECEYVSQAANLLSPGIADAVSALVIDVQ